MQLSKDESNWARMINWIWRLCIEMKVVFQGSYVLSVITLSSRRWYFECKWDFLMKWTPQILQIIFLFILVRNNYFKRSHLQLSPRNSLHAICFCILSIRPSEWTLEVVIYIWMWYQHAQMTASLTHLMLSRAFAVEMFPQYSPKILSPNFFSPETQTAYTSSKFNMSLTLTCSWDFFPCQKSQLIRRRLTDLLDPRGLLSPFILVSVYEIYFLVHLELYMNLAHL